MNIKEEIVEKIDDLISKGEQVLNTGTFDPDLQYLMLDPGKFAEWQTQALNFLINLLGEKHTYVQSFKDKVKSESESDVKGGQGILRAVKEDVLEGYLTNIRTLVSAEVFSDFLEMAEHLLENSYKDPAASLCGKGVYNRLMQKKIKVWIDIRDKADHGQFSEYSKEDVQEMLKGVRDFLADYLK
ncbi:hypothetical protein J7J45_05465 [Candidatus Aerophobetes bacterium]|nr:hypothetical protein [Candidatus Aerophobetes bacterium]